MLCFHYWSCLLNVFHSVSKCCMCLHALLPVEAWRSPRAFIHIQVPNQAFIHIQVPNQAFKSPTKPSFTFKQEIRLHYTSGLTASLLTFKQETVFHYPSIKCQVYWHTSKSLFHYLSIKCQHSSKRPLETKLVHCMFCLYSIFHIFVVILSLQR